MILEETMSGMFPRRKLTRSWLCPAGRIGTLSSSRCIGFARVVKRAHKMRKQRAREESSRFALVRPGGSHT